jgi:hypothetical protein
MTEHVWGDGLGDAAGLGGGADGALDYRLVDVMAAGLAGHRVVVAGGGERPLPGPIAGVGRILDPERVGQGDETGTGGEVTIVLLADSDEM